MSNKKDKKFNFEKLEVWNNSMEWTKNIYSLMEKLPKKERYGLNDQLRRSSSSVPLNIAEGNGRYSNKDFTRFLYNARGSLFETITCLKLAVKLGYLKNSEIHDSIKEAHKIHQKLEGLIRYLKSKD